MFLEKKNRKEKILRGEVEVTPWETVGFIGLYVKNSSPGMSDTTFRVTVVQGTIEADSIRENKKLSGSHICS